MQYDANVWIMRPFNGLFLGVYAVLITLLVITSRLLRGKSFETRGLGVKSNYAERKVL